MNVDEKLTFFSKMAVQEAERERARILADVDERMGELIRGVTADAHKKADAKLRMESSKIERAKNKEVIAASTASKKAVIEKRGSLLDALFEGAAVKLEEYARTGEYKKRIFDDIMELAGRFGQVKVYLMERDLPLIGELPGGCECIGVKDGFVGGFKLLIAERNAVEDHTYLSKLKATRADFNELKIARGTGAEE